MSRKESERLLDTTTQATAADTETFSVLVIEHSQNPKNAGSMEDADAFASLTGPCGDTMEIWLKVKNDRIAHASFWTDGCAPSIACGSMVTEMAKGRTLAEALGIWALDVLEALGGLPDSHAHCSVLASKTLTEAIMHYISSHKIQPTNGKTIKEKRT